MGISDVVALVQQVDPGWLRLTVEGGYLLSLVAWTAATFAVGMICGGVAARLWRIGHEPRQAQPKPPSARAARRAERSAREAELAHRRAMVAGFSRSKARAVLAAHASDGMADVGPYELEVIGSIQAREGVFVMEAVSMCGVTRTGRRYGLTDAWRAFLDDPKELGAVKARAGVE